MKNNLITFDAEDRKGTFMHKEDGKTFIEQRQDAAPILEFVKDKARQTPDKDFKYVGEVPKATLDKALIEGWADDPKAWRRWFQENPKFTAKYYQ